MAPSGGWSVSVRCRPISAWGPSGRSQRACSGQCGDTVMQLVADSRPFSISAQIARLTPGATA
jgi:hypothetical protein